MTDNTDRVITLLEEIRDNLREHCEQESKRLQCLVDANQENLRQWKATAEKNAISYRDSQAAYRESQRRYFRLMPIRATLTVLFFGIIAFCLLANLIIELTGK